MEMLNTLLRPPPSPSARSDEPQPDTDPGGTGAGGAGGFQIFMGGPDGMRAVPLGGDGNGSRRVMMFPRLAECVVLPPRVAYAYVVVVCYPRHQAVHHPIAALPMLTDPV